MFMQSLQLNAYPHNRKIACTGFARLVTLERKEKITPRVPALYELFVITFALNRHPERISDWGLVGGSAAQRQRQVICPQAETTAETKPYCQVHRQDERFGSASAIVGRSGGNSCAVSQPKGHLRINGGASSDSLGGI